MCPRPVPQDPQLATLSVSCLLMQTLWAQENAPWVVRTFSSPRLALFWAERCVVKSWKVKVSRASPYPALCGGH